MELRCAHWNQTDRELQSTRGPLVAGSVRSTKDRDVPALEVKAGTPAVGHKTQDAAGFLAAPIETQLKWPRELCGERIAISLF